MKEDVAMSMTTMTSVDGVMIGEGGEGNSLDDHNDDCDICGWWSNGDDIGGWSGGGEEEEGHGDGNDDDNADRRWSGGEVGGGGGGGVLVYGLWN